MENDYPSLIQQGKNLFNLIKDVSVESVRTGQVKVSKEIKEQRMFVCKSCEFYDETQNKCKKCGCFLNIKTEFQASKCPIGKW